MMNNFDFVGRRKLFALISAGILVVGLLLNLILGVELDVSFKGGTMLKISYTGTIEEKAAEAAVTAQYSKADVQLTTNDLANTQLITVYLTDKLSVEEKTALIDAVQKAFPDNGIKEEESSLLSPSMGSLFFIKCLVAVALAGILLTLYVALRFRRIGGWTAGVMALVALLNDILVAYFIFVIFRIPLNDNFVAVVLSILGYSLNATIVIYDRIRENRRKLGVKMPLEDVVNLSIRQSFTRSMNTSLCVFIAIAVVAVMALAMGMDSIVSFALPMMFGVLSGFYTSTFLCAPLWTGWQLRRHKKAAAQA